jgi:hypothetical protein
MVYNPAGTEILRRVTLAVMATPSTSCLSNVTIQTYSIRQPLRRGVPPRPVMQVSKEK